MLPGPTLPALHGQALAAASRRRGGLYAGRNQRSRHSATVVWASERPYRFSAHKDPSIATRSGLQITWFGAPWLKRGAVCGTVGFVYKGIRKAGNPYCQPEGASCFGCVAALPKWLGRDGEAARQLQAPPLGFGAKSDQMRLGFHWR